MVKVSLTGIKREDAKSDVRQGNRQDNSSKYAGEVDPGYWSVGPVVGVSDCILPQLSVNSVTFILLGSEYSEKIVLNKRKVDIAVQDIAVQDIARQDKGKN